MRKKLLNNNIFPTCPHDTVNFGLLAAETGSLVWGTGPATFNGFHVLASLLQRRSSPKANQLCTMFGRLLGWYTICTLAGLLSPNGIFLQVQNSLCVQILRSPKFAALLHGTQAAGVWRQPNFAAFSRVRHLYSAERAERPSRWAWAHILVL